MNCCKLPIKIVCCSIATLIFFLFYFYCLIVTLSSFFLTVSIIYVVLTGCLPYPARIIKVNMKITHTNYLEKKNERERERKILNLKQAEE